jgi:hypothetical protein
MYARKLAGMLCVAAALTVGCSAAASPMPSTRPTAPPADTGAMIVAASSDGTVVVDPGSESYRGYDSRGELRWVDREAYRRNAAAVCSPRCPDAVFSAASGSPRTWRRSEDRVEPLTFSTGRADRVLTARGASDAVVAESVPGGKDWLHLIRTDGAPIQMRISSAADVLWVENPARSTALTVYGEPDLPDAEVRWFGRDRHGWRPTGRALPATGVWGACLAGVGDLAVLTGPHARMLVDGRAVPIRTDLHVVGECAAGRDAVVVLDRWIDAQDVRHTAVRGVDMSGRQVWARDLATEAEVAADPAGHRFVLVHDGTAEVVDDHGRVIARYGDVVSATFTETGDLVVVDGESRPRRLAIRAAR